MPGMRQSDYHDNAEALSRPGTCTKDITFSADHAPDGTGREAANIDPSALTRSHQIRA